MKYPQLPDSRPERMGVHPVNGVTIIKWRPLTPPPEEDCYVLLRYDDLALGEIVIERASYNQGQFEIRAEDSRWIEIPIKRIRGWAYPIFEPIPENNPPGSEKS